MPWQNPTLESLRALNRDNITAQLRSGPMIPNSVERVMADSNAGLAYLTLLYLNWLALQLMPDTAETEWLDRFGNIWLTNADGSRGRRRATYGSGTALVTGTVAIPLPNGTIVNTSGSNSANIQFQTTAQIYIGPGATPVPIVALSAGETGLPIGAAMSPSVAIAGVSGLILSTFTDGIDAETDDELRGRVLERIRQPPMGGDAEDYVAWALQIPGVTRAWSSPQEMGIGTMTVRIMMDDLRASAVPSSNGFPSSTDVYNALVYLNTKRPVTVKDFFLVAPIPEPIDFKISNLSSDSAATREAIAVSVTKMLVAKARPAYALNGVKQAAQTIYAAWVNDAILSAPGVDHFDLTMADHPMPNNGCMAVLGTITYV